MILALLLVPTLDAEAGTFLRYGIGVGHSADYSSTSTKAFSLGYTDSLLGPIIYQYEGGYWGDSSGHGRRGSGFANGGLGVEANPGVFILRTVWAVGGITTPDTMLGGRFQFNHDFLIGVKGPNEAIIGINIKHISSAGLEKPNLGRDLVMFHVELPF